MKNLSLILSFLITSSQCYAHEQKQSQSFQDTREYFKKVLEQPKSEPALEKKEKRPIGEGIKKNPFVMRETQKPVQEKRTPQIEKGTKDITQQPTKMPLPGGPSAVVKVPERDLHQTRIFKAEQAATSKAKGKKAIEETTPVAIQGAGHQKKVLDLSQIQLTEENIAQFVKSHGQERKLKIILPEDFSIQNLAMIVKSFPLLYSLEIKKIFVAGNDYLEIIKGLQQLKHLTLVSLPGVTDIRAIGEMQSLEYLHLSNLQKVKDFSPLSQLINLKKLVLSKLPSFSENFSFESMRSLKELEFEEINAIKTFSAFKFPKSLKNLMLINLNKLQDVHFPPEFKALQKIVFAGMFEDMEDLSGLESLSDLKVIEMPIYFQIPDIKSILAKIMEVNKALQVIYVDPFAQLKASPPIERFKRELPSGPYQKTTPIESSKRELPSGPYQETSHYVPISESVFVDPVDPEYFPEKRYEVDAIVEVEPQEEERYELDAIVEVDPLKKDD